ncbi:MAG: HAD-IB family phosphatase [Acidimicrobiaceae bacterium]|nr:HAD-IB family phosphatase [Acidimicrobiaceae bacterium]
MIAESLAGKRIAVTGSTGFLGTALTERLLRCVPDCELVLVVRPGRRGAVQRVQRDVLRNDAFDGLRRRAAEDSGGESYEQMTARRVAAVAGDVGVDGLGLDDGGRAALTGCDIVIHSAATVNFDSALDDAVEVNLLGPSRVAAVLAEAGSKAHMIAVSTCYVAGSRRGAAPEQLVDDSPFFTEVGWRDEVDSARRARRDAEQASRSPERLAALSAQARRKLGAAGIPALSEKVESLRRRWVDEQMTRAGRARASSLGFPDAYAFTKALGERALTETRGEIAVSIVRPSIIESALAEPFPGWIRGFRMAEPVIAAYARGLLKEFPGVPEGVVDVIPVDLVVATIMAVAARGPVDPSPDVVQVASGAVNPLKYGKLFDLVSGWFTEHPVYDEHNQPISVPQWSFPGRGRVSRQLQRAQRSLETADRVLSALPLRGRHALMSASLDERRQQLGRANEYVELYGAYAECEAIYQLDRLLELWDSLGGDDRAAFGFDPSVIDWTHYVQEVHLPSMVEQARLKMAPGASSSRTDSRSARLRRQVLAPERQLAVFDLENTLIASNVVASYAWLATRELDDLDRVRFVARTLSEAPRLLALDRRDRSDFLRYFYRRFEGAPVDRIDADCAEMLSDLILTKSFPRGIRRIREHRQAGHMTLLVTGALDFVIAPLKPLFDHIIAAEMGSSGGVYDGRLTSAPPTGEARYQTLVDFAELHGLDLRESVAYADSTSDLPMLEAVGFPVAVNPETKLAALARRRGWLIEHWSTSAGAPAKRLPLAPRGRRGSTRVLCADMPPTAAQMLTERVGGSA